MREGCGKGAGRVQEGAAKWLLAASNWRTRSDVWQKGCGGLGRAPQPRPHSHGRATSSRASPGTSGTHGRVTAAAPAPSARMHALVAPASSHRRGVEAEAVQVGDDLSGVRRGHHQRVRELRRQLPQPLQQLRRPDPHHRPAAADGSCDASCDTSCAGRLPLEGHLAHEGGRLPAAAAAAASCFACSAAAALSAPVACLRRVHQQQQLAPAALRTARLRWSLPPFPPPRCSLPPPPAAQIRTTAPAAGPPAPARCRWPPRA